MKIIGGADLPRRIIAWHRARVMASCRRRG